MTSNRLAILGLGFLAFAMTGAIMLITDMLYGSTVTIVATASLGIAFALLWYLMPLRRLRQQR